MLRKIVRQGGKISNYFKNVLHSLIKLRVSSEVATHSARKNAFPGRRMHPHEPNQLR